MSGRATGMSQIPVPNLSVTSDKLGSLSGPVSSSVKWGYDHSPFGKTRVGVRGFHRFQPGIFTAKSQNISPRKGSHATGFLSSACLPSMQVSSSWLKRLLRLVGMAALDLSLSSQAPRISSGLALHEGSPWPIIPEIHSRVERRLVAWSCCGHPHGAVL